MLYYIKLWDNLSIDIQCIQHLSVVSVKFNGKHIKYNDTELHWNKAYGRFISIQVDMVLGTQSMIFCCRCIVGSLYSHQGNAITLGTITSDDTHTSEPNKMNTNFSNAFSTARHRNGKASILRRLKVFLFKKKNMRHSPKRTIWK